LGQRLNNFFSGFGPYSNQQLQEKEDYWRQYLRDEQTKYGTLVYNGQTIVNPETISRAEVFHYAASIREAEYYKTIRLYTPEEVDRLRGNFTSICSSSSFSSADWEWWPSTGFAYEIRTEEAGRSGKASGGKSC
jgi:hypothetical protein